MKCEECGKGSKTFYSSQFEKILCCNCLSMYKSHPVNDIPENGQVAYDKEGRIICHICGRAFKKVLSHARQRHGIDSIEYKKMFGLDVTKGLASEETKEKLRRSVAENYDKVVKQNLINNGEKTRFKEGDRGRTRDKVSEQTMKRLKMNRIIKK